VKHDRQAQRVAIRIVGTVAIEQYQQCGNVIQRVVMPVRLAVGPHRLLQHGRCRARIEASPRDKAVPASLHLIERVHARALRILATPRKSA
jgi:hypothetical protein